ncbi:drug resistance transporter, EmrB/QacA subfamily [Methanocorpusculum labreanum Z]|uniref:Drug resistance transporter, EmrB/QacA subfamily n=1 Tax=Methanocorpusculum labreanum (strain ATCC 43576 / DSM 4855 / Z) TaxID=410358 RepID=A2SRS3_METLZ|nr:DHA2 family efflux MFS transporter permease subunit [Methanocorpusculum labreanum]ABN07029.1 drug resistance transporter, EmrB/QacA subfamily [Methanocorpusculum labreanum Z]
MTEVITDPLRQKLLLLAVGIAVFVDALDGSVVNIALPVIAAEFGADTGTISWVSLAYLLTLAGLILIFGKLADRGYVKILFIAGFVLFTLCSIVCGLSPDLSFLIVARIFQGVGAAMIAASTPMICVKYLPANMLGVSMGVLTAASSIGFAVGPAIGGVITQFLSWHWIFFINIPIGIFAVLFAVKIIPRARVPERSSFDFAGAAALFCLMVAGVFALERFPHLGISDPLIIASVCVCVVSLIIFCAAELRSSHPVLNIRVFKKRPLTFVVTAFLVSQITSAGFFYLLPFYLSAGMNFDSATSGLVLFIPPAITAALSIPLGHWSDVTERRIFAVAAFGVLAVTSLIYAFIVPAWGLIPLAGSLVLMGLVWGIGGGPASSRVVEQMPKGEEGTGSSLMMTTMYFGCVVGIALYAAVFTAATSTAGGIVSFADLDYATFMYGFHITNAVGFFVAAAALILSAVVKDPPRAK